MSNSSQNTRQDQREKKLIDLSKHLVAAEDRNPIKCLALDVSRNGIGIVSFEELTPETEVILLLKEKGITLKVRWNKSDPVRDGIYHAGLATNDPSVNLRRLLEDEGLIEKAASSTGPSVTQKNAAEHFSYSAFISLLATARTKDNKILRQGKLSKLADTYDAYPINVEGRSLFALLPKGIRPLEASKFDENQAVTSKIFIIRIAQGQLRVIWPVNTDKEVG